MEQLLTTKLYIPPTRPELVFRPRLIERLNEGLHRKLTLISAPAGFGKTTLITEWLGILRGNTQKDTSIDSFAWLSLDANDNDYLHFLTYLVAALNRRSGGDNITIGDKALKLLQSPQPPPVETVLISLINEIATAPNKIILILDDYHLIEAKAIHNALNFLLENLPQRLHLVIATREDPLLPLSRLRARDQLTELRAIDLRFTVPEAAEFLNEIMGLNLSSENLTALETRTEGWIAGLQLAAISLQGQANTSRLIQSFTGSHRLVLDYLIEEVLDQQPVSVQNFLLQTAILNRLNGSLCNAVTGQNNGQATLEMLERSNLFIVSLDNERNWYRYHHLFTDLLRQRLHQNFPEQIPDLHQLASEWYEQQGLWSDAIRHMLASENIERAADLIELAWHPMNTSYQSVTWLNWTKALPDELIRSRPALSTACGWAFLDTGDLETADLRFRDAEQWLSTPVNVNEPFEISPDTRVILNKEETRSLITSIANGRAYLAQALGDVNGTVKFAQQASKLLHENEYFERGLSDILTGFAYWSNGNLEAAYKAVTEAIENMRMTKRIPFIISFTSYLANIMTTQGRLHETIRTYLQLLENVAKPGQSEVKETAVLHLGLSEIYLEQGDIEAAKRHLQKGEKLGEQPSFPPWYRHWICAHVRVMAAQGDWGSVIEMLEDADDLYYRHPIPDVRPLTALLARARLAQGNLTEVQRWVQERGLSVDDGLSYLREFEHLTLVRLLIARFKNEQDNADIQDAIRLLERLLNAAEEGKRMRSIIEILVLQALAYESKDDIPKALVPLKRALSLAEPEGYFRIFVGEGPPIARLLYEALTHDISPDYVQRLLGAFPVDETEKSETLQPHEPGSELIEPLSEREIEILQLIAEGLTNQKIGARLYLSLNTVKAHTRNIYGKLGVNSRTQAAAKARALGLLSSSL